MNISINIQSALLTGEHFKQRTGRVDTAIKNIIKKSIFIIEGHAKYYAPVDTGRMRSSIGVSGYNIDSKFSTGEQSVVMEDRFGSIQPTVTYAKYVERRTPFMAAGAQDSLSEIKSMAVKEIKDAIK